MSLSLIFQIYQTVEINNVINAGTALLCLITTKRAVSILITLPPGLRLIMLYYYMLLPLLAEFFTAKVNSFKLVEFRSPDLKNCVFLIILTIDSTPLILINKSL